MERRITLQCFGMVVDLYEDGQGTIVSDLYTEIDYADNAAWRAAVDGIEATVLAHAIAGINVASPIYVEGIETAIEAMTIKILGGGRAVRA